MNIIEICEKALIRWGPKKQIFMMLEEMTELSVLLFGKLRDRGVDNWQISEEIADVEIMLTQMKILFHNTEEVEDFKIKKLERLVKRLEK